MLNIAVLVSGGGTNLQALLDSEARGENPNGRITLVVASKPGVYALERAAKAGVEGVVVRQVFLDGPQQGYVLRAQSPDYPETFLDAALLQRRMLGRVVWTFQEV